MALEETLGRDEEDVFMTDDDRWLDLVPPEVEWDESETACLVEGLVARSQMRDDS